jgi:hypothetical protein
MGNKSWGKGYHTGFSDGQAKGNNKLNHKTLIVGLAVSIVGTAIPIVSDYIFTKKSKSKKKK